MTSTPSQVVDVVIIGAGEIQVFSLLECPLDLPFQDTGC